MRHFDLNLLRVLVAIHDEGSVSAAALSLRISQPAVSSALARLRQAIGDSLFVKTSRGMDPTPRALSLVVAARDILGRVGSAILEKSAFNPLTCQETFTFAMSDIGEMVFLPKIVEYLQEHAPNAGVRSTTLPPQQVDQGLENGTIDLAVGYFPDLKRSNFYQQRLFTHHFTCLLRSDHPIRGAQVSLKQFLKLGHVVVKAEGRSQEIFERHLEKMRIKRRIVLHTPHFMSIPIIIARTDLITTVPHALGLYLQRSRAGVKMARPPLDIPPVLVKQHWHRKFHQDPKTRWLRGVVSELFNDERDEWREENAGAGRG
jgi:DNA-binding transcriptional LysR family regulator